MDGWKGKEMSKHVQSYLLTYGKRTFCHFEQGGHSRHRKSMVAWFHKYRNQTEWNSQKLSGSRDWWKGQGFAPRIKFSSEEVMEYR